MSDIHLRQRKLWPYKNKAKHVLLTKDQHSIVRCLDHLVCRHNFI